MSGANEQVEGIVAGASPALRPVVDELRRVITEVIPDAIEEPDPSANLVAYTFQPGTYKGLIVAIAPHSAHVNLMFAAGAALAERAPAGLLQGTGKKARHIKFRDFTDVDRPEVRALLAEAAAATPRG